jgi:UDP-N-acetylmuramoyl-tripeptide--D-alanyl-D-alanine ligase
VSVVLPVAALALVAFLFFALKRLLTFLHLFQQEEYDNGRFLAWLLRARAFDRRLTAALVGAGALGALAGDGAGLPVALAVAAIACLILAFREADPRKQGKKPLNLTQRARRILGVALGILAFAFALVVVAIGLSRVADRATLAPILVAVIAIALTQLLPLGLIGANLLLSPFEKRVNARFLREAREILARQKPTVIAITGSYGKTSTKQILAHILSTSVPTLATPGSVNTPLGIARVVREQLKPHHRYFVVEMGAYGIGSIARLCDLTPPDLAAITAVGSAHHERFRSIETVAQAKFEIAGATLARNGRVVLAADGIPRELRAPRVAAAPARYVLVGRDGAEVGSDGYRIEAPEQAADGVAFTLAHKGSSYAISAPVYGLHQVGNIAVAFALAVELGLPPDSAVAALRTLPQVPHRLQVTANPGQATVIDDAYNANPVGFASALTLLAHLAGEARRRILVTPGMVELGDQHAREHLRLGRMAGELVDVALVIGAARIPSFIEGFEEGSRPGHALVRLASFAEAKAWLERNARPTDVILYENDLPDLYERKLSL